MVNKKMRNKYITLALCGALMFIMGGVYLAVTLLTPKPEPPEPTPLPEVIRLIPHNVWDVVSADFAFTDDEDIRFLKTRGGGLWYSEARRHLPIMQDAVNQTLMSFCELFYFDKPLIEDTAGADLGQYGLSPAVREVTVAFNDGTVSKAYIGTQTPDRLFYYVMMGGDPALYLVPSENTVQLLRGYGSFIDRTMPQIDRTSIVYSSYKTRGGDRFEMEPKKDVTPDEFSIMGEFELTAPANLRGLTVSDYEYARLVLQPMMNDIEMFDGRFVSINCDDEKYGFDDPQLEVKIIDSRGTVFHFTAGNGIDSDNHEAYVKFGGIDGVYILPVYYFESVMTFNQIMIIERFIIFLPPVEVAKTEYFFNGTLHGFTLGHSFVTVDGNERHVLDITYTDGRKIDEVRYRAFYSLTLQLLYEFFYDKTPVPDTPPDEWIKFTLMDGTVRLVEFYRIDATFYGISNDGGDISYIISIKNVQDLAAALGALLS
jgi:hypothetical protein